MAVSPLPDAVPAGFLLRWLPEWMVPYAQLARWERPVGFWLLVIPCWWGQLIAHIGPNTTPQAWMAILFFIGAIAMRGAGCTWNDLLDRDLDAQVARTARRPLAAGVLSRRQALIFMGLQALVGLVVALQLPTLAFVVALGSLILVALYPLAKRFISVPQIILGAVFSWGAFVGFAAESLSLNFAALLLYLATAFWILGYDSLYAAQDVEDDLALGIGSAAVRFRGSLPLFVAACYFVCVVLLAGALFLQKGGLFSFIGLAGFALHLGWQVYAFASLGEGVALSLFRQNREAGLLLLAGLVLDCVF